MFPTFQDTSYKEEKQCRRCGETKAWSEFYIRSGYEGVKPGHYNSECKACMKVRGNNPNRLPPTVPRSPTEIIAINYLTKHGIHCLPGKAVKASDVDVVAWGCVWMEVKYSAMRERGEFMFHVTPPQQRRGFLAHIVLLICDYGDRQTFHFLPADTPAFYHKGKLKGGISYLPGRKTISGKGPVPGGMKATLTDDIMTESQDRFDMIETTRLEIAAKLIAS